MDPITLIIIIVVVLLIIGAIGPRTYYRSYSGPPADLLWIVIILLILWLLFGNRL